MEVNLKEIMKISSICLKLNEWISYIPSVCVCVCVCVCVFVHVWEYTPVLRVSLFRFACVCVCVYVSVCTVQTAAHQKKVGDFHNYFFFLCSSLIASPWLSFPGQNLKQNILFLWEENPTFYLFIFLTTDKCQGRYLGGFFLCFRENLEE